MTAPRHSALASRRGFFLGDFELKSWSVDRTIVGLLSLGYATPMVVAYGVANMNGDDASCPTLDTFKGVIENPFGSIAIPQVLDLFYARVGVSSQLKPRRIGFT